MEIEFPTLTALNAEVALRRTSKPEIVVLPSDDPKSRRIGFVVGAPTAAVGGEDDNYLFVRMKNLTQSELQDLTGFLTQAEPELDNLWDAGLMSDVMDKAEELSEGERGALVDQAKLPSTEQMAEWVSIVESGIQAARLPWGTQRIGGSPFTFYWGMIRFKEHHVGLQVKTDHLGLDVYVAVSEGPLWSNHRYLQRVAWADPAFSAAWVTEHVTEAVRVFEAEPQCQCRYHKDIRAGRIL